MPGCMVDTSWPTSEEAYALGVSAGDPMAWAYVVKLWCWGIDADKSDGRAAFNAERFADVCGWKGDASRWFRACLQHAVIVPVARRPGVFYIRGWERNKRYFAEKSRLKAVAEARRVARDNARELARVQHANDTQDPLCNQYPSQSPYQKDIIHAHARPRGAARGNGKADPGHVRPDANQTAEKLAVEDEARATATPPDEALAKIRALANQQPPHVASDNAENPQEKP